MDFDHEYQLEKFKCSTQLRIADYTDRRSEINNLNKDAINLERYAVIGIVAYYGWLLTHGICIALAWAIAIVIPAFGLWKHIESVVETLKNAQYLREIEAEFARSFFPIGPDKGWESWLAKTRKIDEHTSTLCQVLKIERSWYRPTFWVILFILTGLIWYVVWVDPSLICSNAPPPQHGSPAMASEAMILEGGQVWGQPVPVYPPPASTGGDLRAGECSFLPPKIPQQQVTR